MKIIVDADACPRTALQICLKIGQNYSVPVWTVASFNHNIISDHHITVGNASQEADMKILNLTEKGDIVITQDWGLAAMILGKKARCLSPYGREYLPGQIEFMLEEREMKARHRRGGGRIKGPRRRIDKDDHQFEVKLENILRQLIDS